MKVSFFSNFMNHHQLPFCEAMYQLTNGQFIFIAAEPTPQEQLSIGYHEMNGSIPFLLRAYDSEVCQREALQLANESDVILIGSAPEFFTTDRIAQNKLTFRYSERIYKRSYLHLFSPRGIQRMWANHTRHRNKQLYMLCASAFTSGDFALNGAYKDKVYKWGYFPGKEDYDINELLVHKNRQKLLWCGRFIDWKHPDDAVIAAKMLKEGGYSFQLNFIGMGAMEKQLRQMVDDCNLSDCVCFLGAMSPEEVRKHMEDSGIYLFTSDRQEGWGAVLNESMNSGCAVVANHAIGAVPYLLKNKENGLIYHNGNVNELFDKVKYLLDYPEEQKRLGAAAYQTITETWNAKVAAERFINLAQHILDGERSPDLYESGPCSKAEVIKDDWFQ